jgi:hypothetical protein
MLSFCENEERFRASSHTEVTVDRLGQRLKSTGKKIDVNTQ